ncbi:hypothetical protein DEU56DRAFT_919103 [Suillus clintonianus]|uniref:uncharacterized protein n=1 Tax=Suillus clintonianus TaxID=1904413 RepID=UPI001B85CBDC|nr:uncharacterized protein DEU56DRAFT_919103 [Suillus clintonianus]KAG2116972.1 hypothetical protein DEU56DRAFT_919103 [Suillus clintonianus]
MSQPPTTSTQPPSRSLWCSSGREGPAASSEAMLPVAGSPITVSEDTCREIVNDAKQLIIGVIFSANAMTHQTASRQALVTEAVTTAIENRGPEFPNTCFISKQHRSEISGNLSLVQGEIIGHSWAGIFTAYKLYHPKYSTADPVEFRIAKVQELTGGPDPLLFMHEQYVDENGNTVLAKFENMFIMGIVTRFVWYWGRASFVTDSESLIQRMKFIFAVAGAATNCTLLKQGTFNIFVNPFTGVFHERKFQEILAAFEALNEQHQEKTHTAIALVAI